MNFFKTFLATLLALVVGFGLMVMVGSMILVGVIASLGSSTPSVSNNSVLRLNPGTITDAPAGSVLDNFDFVSMTRSSRTTLLTAISAIETAANDNRIKGIYINLDEYANFSLVSLEEIRTALLTFKDSGKFIVAYQENYGQLSYYMASVADKIYMNPEGGFDWRGLAMRSMFYKGLLDKLDIEPVIIRHGTFKSAAEPFMYDKMSPENRLQNLALANSIWGTIVDAVADSRGIAVADLNEWANTLAIDSPEAALEKGVVDGLRYEDQVLAELNSMINNGWSRQNEEPVTGEESDETWVSDEDGEPQAAPVEVKRGTDSDPRIVSFGDYVAQLTPSGKGISKNKIAIIYAEGAIVSGAGSSGEVGSVSMAKSLAKVRKDPNVKAVVLRINSPGGSALASEVIWRELELLKQEVPVIVSMGDYAASGGYYIAAPADVIYTNKTTITGSIGVFGLYFNAGKALKNKLGVTIDVVNTNTYSDIQSMWREPAPAEMRYYQKSVEQVYTTFVGHVVDGRNMTYEAVDKIGQGRVWSGVDAVEIGLVDGFGGIKDAIAIAADRAGIVENFRIWEVVDNTQGVASLLGNISASIRKSVMHDEMGEVFIHYNNLKNILSEDGVQARMPYVFEME